jgi:hypothetical protein
VRILIGDGMAQISSRQQNHNNMPEENLRESGRGAFGIKCHQPQQALTHPGFSPINQAIRMVTAVDLLILINDASQSP